ncbi:MAG: hypothetical protein LBF72_01060 [Holosporales bacterium]|jgi:hypothetical protein|nr:hypothetical protein [Holosporales bacterium]
MGYVRFSHEWLVSVGKLCCSEIQGFEDFIPLLEWQSHASLSASDDLAGSAAIGPLSSSGVTFVVPNGEHGPKIEQQLYSGKFVEQMIVARVAWNGEETVPLQKTTFSKVRIIELCQNIRYLTITAKIAGKESDFQDFDHEGKAKGHKVNSFDFSVGK